MISLRQAIAKELAGEGRSEASRDQVWNELPAMPQRYSASFCCKAYYLDRADDVLRTIAEWEKGQ